MIKVSVVVLSSFNVPAQAHESLAPHAHPHALSSLPGIDAVVWALVALASVLILYWKVVRERQRE